MSDNKNQAPVVVTPVGRLVFDKNLFEADEKGRFRAALLIEKDADLKKLKEICGLAATEKWGNKVPKNLKMPIKMENRDEMLSQYPFMEGVYTLNAATKFEVPVQNRAGNELFRSDIGNGDYCRFAVSAWAYDANGNVGVGLNLLGVEKLKDGEQIFSKPSARDIFGNAEVNGFAVEESAQETASEEAGFSFT